MGIGLWLVSGAAVFLVSRASPAGRSDRWLGELLTVLTTALLLGALATALDFGGWNEPDWRAGLFVLFGSAAVAGTMRVVRLATFRQ
jgi:hypothetical protein